MLTIDLYHGRGNHAELDKTVLFFSTCSNFSANYGEVREYTVVFKNLFDGNRREHIESLIGFVGPICDTYDDAEYDSFDQIAEANLLGSDTWELLERYMFEIQAMGFDGIKIYEGGTENYVAFESEQYKLKETVGN